ncbi:MAG: AsmA family protein [Cyanobacteria bacterium P01_A01_bin.17]
MGKGTLTLGVLGGGLTLGVVLAGIGWLQRDAILDFMLERTLRSVTGVEAQLREVNSQPFQGEFEIDTLLLSNPDGFKTPYVLKVDRLEIKLDPDTLWQDTVRIQSIAVEGVQIQLEQKLARNNIATIVDQLQASKGGGSGGSGSNSGSGKQIEIDRLTIRGVDAQVKVSAIANLGLTRTLEIEDIEVTNLDTYNAESKLLEAISSAVTTAILSEIGKSATGDLIPL